MSIPEARRDLTIVSENSDESQQGTGNAINFPGNTLERSHPSPRQNPAVFSTILIVVSLLFVIFSTPRSPFVTRGEAREGLVVRAMVTQDNVILPLRNGREIPSKPPLFHWSGLAFERMGLAPETALRLPSAFAAGAMVILLFAFSSPILGARAAALSGLLLYATFDVLRVSRAARVDMMFSLWVSATLFALFMVVNDFAKHGRRNRFALGLATGCAALAILTKGPAGLAFPWTVAGLTMLLTVPVRKIPFGLAALSIAGSIALAGIWYAAAYSLGGQAFLDIHLMRENYARVVGSTRYSTGHRGAVYMPVLMLLAGLLPASALLPLAYPALRKFSLLPGNRVTAIYIGLWALIFPVFFSFTASQRNVYLLPSFPAWGFVISLALLNFQTLATGHPRLAQFSKRGLQVFGFISALVSSLVLVFLAFPSMFGRLLAALPVKQQDRELITSVFPMFRQSGVLIVLLLLALPLSLVSVKNFKRSKMVEGYLALVGAVLCLQLSVSNGMLPHLAERTTPQPFAQTVLSYVQARGKTLYQYDDNFFSMNYYIGTNLLRLNETDPIPKDLPIYLLMRSAQVPKAARHFPRLSVVATSEMLDFYGKDRFTLVEIPGAG